MKNASSSVHIFKEKLSPEAVITFMSAIVVVSL